MTILKKLKKNNVKLTKSLYPFDLVSLDQSTNQENIKVHI